MDAQFTQRFPCLFMTVYYDVVIQFWGTKKFLCSFLALIKENCDIGKLIAMSPRTQVYEGTRRNHNVAIKRIDKGKGKVALEIEAYRKHDNGPNVARFYDHFEHDRFLDVVLE